MSKYKRHGLFPIYKSDQSQDWELSGYYDNFNAAFQFVPKDVLVGFRTPPVDGVKTAPTEITIRKISIKGGVKSIIESNNYTVTMYRKLIENDTQTYYYFNQSPISSDPNDYLDEGELYEIYIIDADNNSFISNIFIAVDESELYLATESGFNILTESGEEIKY